MGIHENIEEIIDQISFPSNEPMLNQIPCNLGLPLYQSPPRGSKEKTRHKHYSSQTVSSTTKLKEKIRSKRGSNLSSAAVNHERTPSSTSRPPTSSRHITKMKNNLPRYASFARPKTARIRKTQNKYQSKNQSNRPQTARAYSRNNNHQSNSRKRTPYSQRCKTASRCSSMKSLSSRVSSKSLLVKNDSALDIGIHQQETDLGSTIKNSIPQSDFFRPHSPRSIRGIRRLDHRKKKRAPFDMDLGENKVNSTSRLKKKNDINSGKNEKINNKQS